MSGKRLSRRAGAWLMAGVLVLVGMLMIGGFVVGYAVSNTNRLVAEGAGFLLGGAAGVVADTDGCVGLRGALKQRGYDLPPIPIA